MKFAKLSEAAGKTPPGHFDMRTFSLFQPDGANKLGISVSHYLPGGGAEYGPQPVEVVFYVLSGEITIKAEAGEYSLREGDSVRISKGEMKGVNNNSNNPATILVIANVDGFSPMPDNKE